MTGKQTEGCKNANMSHKTLFLDWKEVESGFQDVCLDRSRLSGFGKEHLEDLAS